MAYEKMNCLYETADDLQARLGNTLCRYKGQPVWIVVVNAKNLDLMNITQEKVITRIKPDDPDFDISSAEVGYVNYEAPDHRRPNEMFHQVCYLERTPFRRYRQGLNSDSLSSYNIKGGSGTPAQSVLTSKGMEDALMNRYPTMREALEILSSTKRKEIAVSQDIALQKTDAGIVLVYYRQDNVGWITPDSQSISIERSSDSWVYSRIMRRFMNGRA